MYKFLAADLVHNGFKYKEGLNVDPIEFNPHDACQPGGLYFTRLRYLNQWCRKKWPLIADVTLPDGAQVYAEPCGTKFKADRIIIKNIRPVNWFLAELNEDTLLHILQPIRPQDSAGLIRYITSPSEKVSLAALRCNPKAIHKYVPQTPEFCVAAVKSNCVALHWIKEQTHELCVLALDQAFDAIYHIRNPTPQLLEYVGRRHPGHLAEEFPARWHDDIM